MNEIEMDRLKKLDAHAQTAPPPPTLDVSTRVLATLRSPMRLRTLQAAKLDAPASLWAATGLSWAAAAAALFFALQSVTSLQDPFNDLFTPLRMVLR
ncbi:MAG: hypothetical protein ACTHN5_20510 [Phycisphaerae bacterium]